MDHICGPSWATERPSTSMTGRPMRLPMVAGAAQPFSFQGQSEDVLGAQMPPNTVFYFFIPCAHVALLRSALVTGAVLLIFGAVKARVTGAGIGTSGYVWGAVNTLFVGGVAAAAAFGIVNALEGGE
ncbi:hypothetical protein B0H10DRAFT_1943356 [Mycena sp. CBHHK59/15]|nr:hypothetical protein B0H10DRAFT_1943356 [Mycena sp. CBHHK59/15]